MIKLENLLILIFLAHTLSCSRVTTLNMLPYQGVRNVKNTIWFHLEGLSEEHVALIKFIKKSQTDKTAFEQMNCIGQVWNYNFFDLRPKSLDSFMMFLAGSKDTANTCGSFANEPVWFNQAKDQEVVMIEHNIHENQSIDLFSKCDEKEVHNEFLKSKTLIMRKAAGQKLFHNLSIKEIEPGLQYDLSCQQGECQTSLSENIMTLLNDIRKSNQGVFLVIRDGSINKLINEKKVIKLREYLLELEKLFGEVIKIQSRTDDTRLIITSSNSIPIELPSSGEEWRKFENSGINVLYKRESLQSPLYVRGPGSQNFCGIFEAADFSKRLYWEEDNKFLLFDFGWFR
jgi:hypothetical protein